MNKTAYVVALCTSLGACTCLSAQVSLTRTVALSDEQALGLAPGILFTGFENIRVNDNGSTAFFATLEGPGVNYKNDDAIYSEALDGNLRLVIGSGASFPGANDGTDLTDLNEFSLMLNNSGQTSFAGRGNGPNVTVQNNQAIFREDTSGDVLILAREGSAAPGLGGGVLLSEFPTRPDMRFSDSGALTYISDLTGTAVDDSNNEAIFADVGGQSYVVARKGDEPTSDLPGTTYGGFGSEIAINKHGQIIFGVGLDRPQPGVFSSLMLWSPSDGTTVVSISGDQVPGNPAGYEFGSPNRVRLSDSGHVAFQTRLGGFGNDAIIRTLGASNYEIIAVEDEPAPGFGDGATYGGVGFPVLNDNGDIAFPAAVNGSVNTGAIFSDAGGGGLAPVMTLGEQAPGLADGMSFNSFRPESIQLNNAGQIATFAFVLGDSIGLNGIFATDLEGIVQLVAYEGQLFDVNSDPDIDDLREIDDLSDRYEFNNAGQVAFTASFTDGTSGVFLVTVPSPGSVAVLGVLTIFTLPRARRHASS